MTSQTSSSSTSSSKPTAKTMEMAGMSVMFHIVEDESPPIPEDCSDSLKDFLRQCFQKDPAARPRAEVLFEHQWLKRNWGAHKELRPQDSIPFLRRVSADLQKSDIARQLALDIPHSESPLPDLWNRSDELAASPGGRLLATPGAESEMSMPRAHSFVKVSKMSKAVICRVCHQSVTKSAVLCEECSLIAHARCANDAPPTCDLRAQLLQYAQYSQTSPTPDILQPTSPVQSPTPTPFSLSSSPPAVIHDGALQTPSNAGFRIFPWKRKSSNALNLASSPEPSVASPPQRPVIIHNNQSQSRASVCSSHQSSSIRSAVTAADTLSSSGHGSRINESADPTSQRQSSISDGNRASRITQISTATTTEYGRNDLPDQPNPRLARKRESMSSRASSRNGCVIQ